MVGWLEVRPPRPPPPPPSSKPNYTGAGCCSEVAGLPRLPVAASWPGQAAGACELRAASCELLSSADPGRAETAAAARGERGPHPTQRWDGARAGTDGRGQRDGGRGVWGDPCCWPLLGRMGWGDPPPLPPRAPPLRQQRGSGGVYRGWKGWGTSVRAEMLAGGPGMWGGRGVGGGEAEGKWGKDKRERGAERRKEEKETEGEDEERERKV